jgi:4'-phosphopantetheinyl transferase EntD
MSQPQANAMPAPEALQRSEKLRRRTEHVRQRLCLATDALAAADLLLGVNLSLGAVGRKEKE